MKRLFFLPSEISYGLPILFVFSFFRFPADVTWVIGIVSLITFILFRRSFIPYRDTLKNDGEIFLAPTHGLVKSVRLNVASLSGGQIHHEVRISISNFVEKGLYMPTSAEVSYLRANKGVKIPKDSDAQAFFRPMDEVGHTDLTLMSKNRVQTLLRFIDCKYGRRPTIWLKSGDRGRGAACFGYYPFGGTLIVYLPHHSDVLVFEGEKVVPGQSVIAAFKDF